MTKMRLTVGAMLVLATGVVPVQAQWVQFTNETATRFPSGSLGASDIDEKDYAWGDVDRDGDLDLVSVRKEPFTSPGKRVNVLYMNENGVLVDRTTQYATATDVPGDMGFNTPTNDRDVLLVDVNGDNWLDIVTAVTISDGDPKHIGHPRIYINLKDNPPGSGIWQGFRFENNRIPTMLSLSGSGPPSINPRFCSVAAGDLNGDGMPELWFGDYDSSGAGGSGEPPGNDYDDRLLLNDGNGFFTDVTSTAFAGTITVGGSNYLFRTSAFGAAESIADMNGDGWNDIVKQTSLNPPQYVGIAFNKGASNPGFFDSYKSLYTLAPYFISTGDLNNDNRLDIVVTDDNTDAYLLNTGNSPNGQANFNTFNFPASTNGFGSQSVIADLNNDGWRDVVISDVDVDIPGCSRVADILRNNANAPNVTFTADSGNIASGNLTGVHNFAVFDINGDGWKDLVIGRCSGTQVWIQNPPSGIQFTFPGGTPTLLTPNQPTQVQVTVQPVGTGSLQPNSGRLYYRLNGGAWNNVAMSVIDSNNYMATIPACACATRVDYYFSANLSTGATFYNPSNAPDSYYNAVAAVGTQLTTQDFETDTGGFTVLNDPSLTGGAWERADPVGSINGTIQAAPDDDAQAGTQFVYAFITQNGVPGGNASAADVDGGPTHLISPVIDLGGTDATISYAVWMYCDDYPNVPTQADVLTVYVSNDGGSNWVTVQNIPSTTSGTQTSWQSYAFLVGDYVTPTANVRVRFTVGDPGNNSITEAGVDLFQITKYVCTTVPACACPADVSGDQTRDAGDIRGFITCLIAGGHGCDCADMDGGGVTQADVPLFVAELLNAASCPP